MEIFADLAGQPGSALVVGRCGLLLALSLAGRAEEAMAIAEDTVAVARAHGNPLFVAMALTESGLAFAQADPARALRLLHEGLIYAQQHRVPLFEGIASQNAAGLETLHGDAGHALALFDTALDIFHGAGNVTSMGSTLAHLAVCFDRLDWPDVAATLYGASTKQAIGQYVVALPAVVDHLHATLGDAAFDRCAATGAGMDLVDAVGYARRQIELADAKPSTPSPAAHNRHPTPDHPPKGSDNNSAI